MAKVEFVKHEIKGPEDVAPAIERLRSAAEELASRDALKDEAITRIAEDIKQVVGLKDALAEANARAAKAEEIAKTAHEIARGSIEGDDKAVAEVRALPLTRTWDKSDTEDMGFEMDSAHYALTSASSDEVRTAIGDGAGAALWRRFCALNDQVYTVHKVLLASYDTERRMDYIRKGGMKSLKAWSAYERAAKQMQRAFDTATAGAASEWVPTMYSTQFFEDLTLPTGVIGQIQFLPMPNNPWAFPVVLNGTTMDVTIVGESTTAAGTGFPSADIDTPASGSFTLKAVKHGRMSTLSREINQDSIVAVLPVLSRHILLKHRYALSQALIDGQPVSSSLGTLDTARAITAGSGVRDSWASCTPASWGIRRSCHASATPVDFGGTMTTDSLAAMIGAAKQAGQPGDTFFLGGFSVLARALILKDGSGANVYLTQEKAGAMATSQRGEIGMLMGRPLVLDGMYPEDLNASGIYDGTTTTKTSLMLVNRTQFVGGQRQGVTLDTSEHYYFKGDLTAVRSTARFAFAPYQTPSTSARVGVAGINIPSYS